jgi:D-sedoheptulose 7-phosphate isomerase
MSIARVNEIINESLRVKQLLLSDEALLQRIVRAADTISSALKSDRKILFCGNGGSAADAQHLAAELSGRFYRERKPLFAEALHENASYMTAVANDYSFEQVYSRLVQAKGRVGDVLVCLSTSGNSANVVAAAKQARSQQVATIGLTGKSGGALSEHCDLLIAVPSTDAARTQEAHMLIGHIICELVESGF